MIAIGLAIFTTFRMNGTAWTWDALLAVFLPVFAGFGFAGLDYVVRIEPGNPASSPYSDDFPLLFIH